MADPSTVNFEKLTTQYCCLVEVETGKVYCGRHPHTNKPVFDQLEFGLLGGIGKVQQYTRASANQAAIKLEAETGKDLSVRRLYLGYGQD